MNSAEKNLFKETVVGFLEKRSNSFKNSKEVSEFSFKEKNKYLEHWAGMYLFEESNPTEESLAYGNFYLEIDETDFSALKDKILFIISFLERKGISRSDLTLYTTNRSIWISVPAKIFATYKMKDLHLVHKEMAKQINRSLISQFEGNGLDLSIYRWNGLTRTLGSYLKESNCRVMKLEIQHLENSYEMSDLRVNNYDRFGSFSELKVSAKAKKWFFQAKKTVEKAKKEQRTARQGVSLKMEEFIERGEIDFNRNLHIYSIALYLKGKGMEFKEVLSTIQSKIKNNYVFTAEAVRTIASAFKSNKQFSIFASRDYLDSSIFEEEFSTEGSDTFIVPRKFLDILNSKKVHVNTYKYLVLILKEQQVNKSSFKLSLANDKYKKLTLSYFEKLAELGFINHSYDSKTKELTAKLVYKDASFYKNHIVLSVSFVETNFFKESKREFIVLLELLRASYSFEELKYYTSIKFETLNRKLKLSPKTIKAALARFKELGLLNGRVYSLEALEVNTSHSETVMLEVNAKGTVEETTTIESAYIISESLAKITGVIRSMLVSVSNLLSGKPRLDLSYPSDIVPV